MSKPDGYRYIRSYRVQNDVKRYALYEVQNERARRVGTAQTEVEAYTFLGCADLLAKRTQSGVST